MGVSKAEEIPEEYAVGAKIARFARKRTGERIAELVVDSDLTGSRELLRLRLAKLIEAEKDGDPLVLHEAYVELAAAAAVGAVGVQLRTPFYLAQLRGEKKALREEARAAVAEAG